MKGKTVIITGGARGLGKAAALKLASLGANLVINYLGNDKADAQTALRKDHQHGQRSGNNRQPRAG